MCRATTEEAESRFQARALAAETDLYTSLYTEYAHHGGAHHWLNHTCHGNCCLNCYWPLTEDLDDLSAATGTSEGDSARPTAAAATQRGRHPGFQGNLAKHRRVKGPVGNYVYSAGPEDPLEGGRRRRRT